MSVAELLAPEAGRPDQVVGLGQRYVPPARLPGPFQVVVLRPVPRLGGRRQWREVKKPCSAPFLRRDGDGARGPRPHIPLGPVAVALVGPNGERDAVNADGLMTVGVPGVLLLES